MEDRRWRIAGAVAQGDLLSSILHLSSSISRSTNERLTLLPKLGGAGDRGPILPAHRVMQTIAECGFHTPTNDSICYQPGGLPDGSRRSTRSGDLRFERKKGAHPGGVPEGLIASEIWNPSGMHIDDASIPEVSLRFDLRLPSDDPSGVRSSSLASLRFLEAWVLVTSVITGTTPRRKHWLVDVFQILN